LSDSPIPRREVFCDKAALAVLFLFLIVGFLTVGRYSYTIDEPAVIRRGQASIQFVKNFFVGKGMPNGPDGQAFWSMYHPPLYGMMLAAASHVLEINLGIESIVARHVANILWATVGLWFLFLLGRRLFGSAAGLAALLFMIFFPRFIAHAHYNPKDVPTMVWGVIAVYALVVFQGRPSLKSAVFAGAALGLGVATGLNVLFLLPVAFVAILSVGGVRARMAIVMVLSFVAATVLAWPQLWVRPAHFLNAVHFFSGSEWWPFEVLYFGRTYMAKDLPWR
jgi:4-amino-4-deoxy-L-arabinose transferase-like glycosyltransferase